jgi:environmental stress-induced protein Ves
MKYSIYTPADFETINWAGGTSTELFIFPDNANYKERKFDFRLSTATVEIEKSDFTPLPGISRHLMILNGAIEVCHEGQYRKQMKAFDVDSFEGEWNTSSVGQCTDFNLMTQNNCKGKLSSIDLNTNETDLLKIDKEWKYIFAYAYEGEFILKQTDITLNKGNLLCIHVNEDMEIPIEAIKKGHMVLALVK